MPVEQIGYSEQNFPESTCFADWLTIVDQYVWQFAGCSVHDLPDCNFHPLFTDGLSAEEMAIEALEQAGFHFPDDQSGWTSL